MEVKVRNTVYRLQIQHIPTDILTCFHVKVRLCTFQVAIQFSLSDIDRLTDYSALMAFPSLNVNTLTSFKSIK